MHKEGRTGISGHMGSTGVCEKHAVLSSFQNVCGSQSKCYQVHILEDKIEHKNSLLFTNLFNKHIFRL